MVTARRITSRGFTLIELTVALVIFAMMGTALAVALRNGMRTWERLNTLSDVQHARRYALHRLERDFTHAVLLTGANDVPPMLTAEQMSFVTRNMSTIDAIPRLTRVAIRCEILESGAQGVVRYAAPYPADPFGTFGRAVTLFAGLEQCTMAYAYLDPVARQLDWLNLWHESDEEFPAFLPRGVRLQLGGPGVGGDEVIHAFEMPIGAIGSQAALGQ